MKDDALGCFGAVILLLLLLIFSPFICFCGGWVTGLLIQWIFADTFLKGLALLGIIITKSQIPLFCGILGVIGSFFKSSIKTNSNK